MSARKAVPFQLWPALLPNEKVTHRGYVDLPDGRYIIEAKMMPADPAKGCVAHFEGTAEPLRGKQETLV